MTNQPEPTVGCRSCGAVIVATLKDIHKAKGCPAVLANQLYQYRTQHGGLHVQLDDAIKSIDGSIESLDKDTEHILERLDTLEQRPTTDDTPAQEGVQISGWLDDDTYDELGLTPDQYQPTTDGPPEVPILTNPLEPALIYSTATDLAQVDDLEARTAAQTGNLHL